MSDPTADPLPVGETPAERRLRCSQGGKLRHAKHGSADLAEAGQEALVVKYELEVDPDGKLSPVERRRRALLARDAHMQELARRSSIARRARRGAA